MAKNLWGEMPKAESIRLPSVILQEQADLIDSLTNGVIKGKVDTGKDGDGDLYAQLSLVVPLLNNYRYYLIFTYSRGVKVYPAFLKEMDVEGPYTTIAGPEEFENALGKMLSSKNTKEVIAGLLAQATSLSSRTGRGGSESKKK